jgi:streptogramin lyase
MSITYTGGGMASPTALAVDSTGSVWVANYSYNRGGTAAKMSASGIQASATGFADPALYESYAMAVDAYDNAWITNEESSYLANGGDGTLTKFDHLGNLLSGSGLSSSIYYPYGIAADSNGDMWVADYGNSEASLLNNGGTPLGTSPYFSAALTFPVGVALDGSHNAWFAAEATAVKVTPSGAISAYICCRGPSGIALDPSGNVWVSDYSGTAVVELNSAGTVLQTLTGIGGLYYPESLAIDGAGVVWVANYHANDFSAFTAASGGAASTALSPSIGFGLDAGLASPFGVALDASGDVWLTNFASDSVTQFVGLASPVKTPLLGLPAQP